MWIFEIETLKKPIPLKNNAIVINVQKGEDDEEVDVEGEFEEYTWAGQTRIRATSFVEGGLAGKCDDIWTYKKPLRLALYSAPQDCIEPIIKRYKNSDADHNRDSNKTPSWWCNHTGCVPDQNYADIVQKLHTGCVCSGHLKTIEISLNTPLETVSGPENWYVTHSYKNNYRWEGVRYTNAWPEVIIFCKSRPSDCNNSYYSTIPLWSTFKGLINIYLVVLKFLDYQLTWGVTTFGHFDLRFQRSNIKNVLWD